MKSLPQKTTNPLLSLICTTFGHRYIISRKVTNHVHEYCCTHCGREVTDANGGKIEELTSKIKEVNTNLAEFFQKKRRRLSA
ncbi:MAG: hypothetical protein MK211_07905 [Flavobacteriales bacterium]|jgi:hypothetical protein|uniref:hypothetical protein n=1 Tax=Candidatus Ulvibacter alkanivorans TaxID=2267620 RepID=UPI000DF315BC|nr:hypothetical protein [Candidatus Ulvibacter alkanivorans]MCH2490057.1 hypothetical protein [Flavobacteriales bacterium]